MDSTYAPQSPDLSSFLSSPPKTQQPYHPAPSSSSYAPRSPQIPSYDGASGQPYNHNLNAYQQSSNTSSSAFGGGGALGNNFEYHTQSQYLPPIPALPASHSFTHGPGTTSSYNPQPQQGYQPQPHYQPQSPPPFQKIKSEPTQQPPSFNDHPAQSATMPPRGPRSKNGPSSSNDNSLNPQPERKDPNPNNIEIKTKFPVARIKRIMQADEEVGKVAQVTPVAVNKALELFMIALVTGAADRAREKGGKKVTAQHLKSVVLADESFDFLTEIVDRVSEAQEGAGGEGKKRKAKSEKVDSESSEAEEKKGVKKGRGRKKKTEA